jgi:hypothetical protein
VRTALRLIPVSLVVTLASCAPGPAQPPAHRLQTKAVADAANTPGGFYVALPQAPGSNLASFIFGQILKALIPPHPGSTTTCTVTGQGAINTGTPVVVQYTVNVTQPASGPPSGTVTISENVPPPFLQSSSITAVACSGNRATITGTLVGGGTFSLNGVHNPPGTPDYVTIVTPYFYAYGPVSGTFIVTQ